MISDPVRPVGVVLFLLSEQKAARGGTKTERKRQVTEENPVRMSLLSIIDVNSSTKIFIAEK